MSSFIRVLCFSTLFLSQSSFAQNCYDTDFSGCGYPAPYIATPTPQPQPIVENVDANSREIMGNHNSIPSPSGSGSHGGESIEGANAGYAPSSAGLTSGNPFGRPDGQQEPAKAPSAAPSQTAQEPTVDEAVRSKAETALLECESDGQSVIKMCQTDRDSSYTGLAVDGLDAASITLGALPVAGTASGSSYEACKQASNAAMAANGAMAAVKANCANSYNSCKTSCQEASSLITRSKIGAYYSDYSTRLTEARKNCSSAQSRIQRLDLNLQALAQKKMQSDACVRDVSSGTDFSKMTQAQLMALCSSNQSSPACSYLPQDCNNPAMASSNRACICSRNPSDPQCSNYANSTTLPMGSGAADSEMARGGANGGLSASASLMGGGRSGNDFSGMDPNQKDEARGGVNIPGSSAGGGGNSSGRGANDPDLNKKNPKYSGSGSSLNTNIIAGRTGGPSGAMGTGRAPNVGTVRANGSWIPPKVSDKPSAAAGVDLNRFRPEMQMKVPRLLAGMNSELGGPNGTLWQRINFVFENKGSGFNP